MGEHNHDHECGCGCGHDHEHEHEYVTLTLDDGTEMNCIVLCIFPVEDKDYIALLPEENADDEDGEVFLYRFIEGEDGEPELLNIDDDDEFEKVTDAFDEILDSEEFEELLDDEEEENE